MTEKTHGTAVKRLSAIDTISVAEAAKRLGVSRASVYRMNRSCGPFTIYKVGHRVLIDRVEFDRYRVARAESDMSGSTPQSTAQMNTPAKEQPNRYPGASGQRDLVIRLAGSSVAFYVW